MKGKLLMSKIKLIALFGKSGAGKDTIQHWLQEHYDMFNGLVSYTTRPPRGNEVNGKDYNFISTQEFLDKLSRDEILEYAEFNEWYYGTAIDAFDENKINLGVFNIQGIRSLMKYNDKIEMLPVYIDAPDRIRLLRALQRESNPDCYEICRRYLADEKDFQLLDFYHEYYYNDNDLMEFYGFFNRPKVKKFLRGDFNERD
jgi:guanylate kinase